MPAVDAPEKTPQINDSVHMLECGLVAAGSPEAGSLDIHFQLVCRSLQTNSGTWEWEPAFLMK